MVELVVGHSDDVNIEDALDQAIDQVKEQAQSHSDLDELALLVFSDVLFANSEAFKKIRSNFPSIPLVGATSDGELSSKLVFAEDSITLGLLLGQGVQANTYVLKDLSQKELPVLKQELIQQVGDLSPKLCFNFSESMTVSGDFALEILSHLLSEDLTILGGMSADQWTFRNTYQFFNGEILEDSMVGLLLSGEIESMFLKATGWKKIGKSSIVTEVEKNIIYQIDNKPALDFYGHYLGSTEGSFGEYPLMIDDGSKEGLLRAPLVWDKDMGSITFAGEVPLGSKVSLSSASRSEILSASREICIKAAQNKDFKFVVLVVCAARKHILGSKAEEEIQTVVQSISPKPMIGFYAYGEYCSSQVGSDFLNESFNLLMVK